MKKLLASILSFSPTFAFAQTPLVDINTVAAKANSIGNLFVELLISLAVIYIIYSVVRYLIAGGDEDRGKAGMNILYGVVGLFVILSIWGLVFLLVNTFRFGDNRKPINEIRNIQNNPLPPVL